jgi:tetratricopeptide (TPR) repeat protein
VYAKHYVSLLSEDHDEGWCPGPTLTINTPYIFSWYCSISYLTLSADTLVFLLAGWDYSHRSNLPGTVIPWHDARFVLRDNLQNLIEEDFDVNEPWHTDSINDTLKRGEPILREGVTLTGIQTCKAAADAQKIGDTKLAWLHYQEAARLAPTYYPAVYNMGQIMSKEGAIKQALPYLERAASLYPTVQKHLLNEAAFNAIILACWLDQIDRAKLLVNQYLPLNQHYKLRRARAEVLLIADDLEEAMQDLDAVLEQHEDYASALWLRGLLAWKHGKKDEATKWQKRAISKGNDFKASYESHICTSFLSPKTTQVNWETLTLNKIKPVQDEAWWLALIKSDYSQANRLPKPMRTTAFLSALFMQQAEDITHLLHLFPAKALTPELALKLVQENGNFLADIPLLLRDEALCQVAVEQGASLEDVPQGFRTEAICRRAIKGRIGTPRGCYEINHVPTELQTEDMWLLALAYSNSVGVNDVMPSLYTKPEALHKALGLNKAFLDELPGNLFDAATYSVAESLYGQDADWNIIQARHKPHACKGDYANFAEKCWLVFWDEASILKNIKKKSCSLHTFEIPDSQFSTAITEACFRIMPIHMSSIPARFITKKMCNIFMRQYANHLKDIPFSMRSVDICVKALRENFQQYDLVPAPVFAEVMASLYQDIPPNVNQETVALQYGRGLLMASANPNTAIEVLSELCSSEWIKQAPCNESQELDEDEATAEALRCLACYLLGYAHHLLGNVTQAETLQQRSGLSDSYQSFDPQRGQAHADFDPLNFDQIIYEYDMLVNEDKHHNFKKELRHQLAWPTILQARQLLQDNGNSNSNPTLWAYVLDRQRWISHELQDWDNNLAVCEEAVRQLSTFSLWAYLPEHNVIRSALRAALHQLGNAPLDIKDDPTEAEIIQAVEYIWKALQLIDSTENQSETWHFYDAQLWNLAWLAERDSKWQATLNQTMKRVTEFDWQEYLYTDKAIEMMKAYTKKNKS